jgi:hypothetical protein
LNKTARKTLEKDSFIKVFKYTGEFAKLKCADLKLKSQEKRCQVLMTDHVKYLESLKLMLIDEEKAY